MKKSAVGIMSHKIFQIFSLGFILLLAQNGIAAQVSANVIQVADAIHVEFKGLNQWDYNLDKKSEKNSTTFEIEVPRLSEPAVMALKNFKSPSVESVAVQHDGPDGKDIITIKLNGAELEAFDYLTDQPSRLIIDIYPNKKSEKKKTAAVKPTQEKKTKTVALPKKSEVNRAPSSMDRLTLADAPTALLAAKTEKPSEDRTNGAYDAADPNFDRFKIKDYEIKPEAMIAAKENYYLDFPMLRMKLDEFDKLVLNHPIYEIKPKDTDENKQVRLLKTLFENKRYNVFLKAVEWFFNKYPNSEYEEIVRFMWADVYFQQWVEQKSPKEFDLAMTRYRHAIEKFPKSPLIERTKMLIGFSSLERGDYLATLKLFHNQVRNRPASLDRDLAQFAIAESYLKLARYDEAMQTYQEIEKDSFTKKSKIQAMYFKGDIEYRRGDFAKAIELYKTALQKEPEAASELPNAFYNQASAYFKLDKPKESLNTFIEFVKLFPNHEYAGYAMTRIGEILDMMGADKTKVMGAYFETQFRYGEAPSAVVARMRILATRMKSMKEKEAERAQLEIVELAKKSPLPKIEQFANILVSEGLSSRSNFESAIGILVKFYQANPTTSDSVLLANRISKAINLEIKHQVDSGKFIEALKTHSKYADNWLKNSDRIDTAYNVGSAFEQAGVFKQSEKLYKDTLNRMQALQGTQIGNERNIFERLPSLDVVNLRLANTEFALGNYSQSHEYMKAIKDPGALSYLAQVERVQLAARLSEKKGDIPSAIRHLVDLVKEWKGIPELLASAYLQLAELEVKQEKKNDAIQSLQKVDQLVMDSQNRVPAAVHAKALEQLGALYFEKGDTASALKTYTKLLDAYETSRPLSSIRYKVGQIYFKNGDLQKASDVWNSFKGEKSETWKKLAQEQLKNSEWNGEYKKYINRIPAMSERK